ncbi:MAG: hypothetical protein IJ343_04100 [Clostridia bacterium]|nr:hypothetical protein [Clostridia bacterium]
MMKRILTLLLVLLLLPVSVPARAADAVPEALYRIVLRTEDGDRTLGTAVLFGSQQMLLTVRGCWQEGELYAIGADGEHRISYRGEIIGSQLITLGLATQSAAQPLPVTTAEYLTDFTLYGASASGGMTAMQVTASRVTVIDDRAEALVTAQEGMLPGAVMLGGDGGLACITAYQYGEALGTYAAIADTTLGRLSSTADEEPQTHAPGPDAPQLLKDFSVTVAEGRLTVDWSEALTAPVTEETVFTVYASIVTNPYLSYDKVTGGETSTSFLAVPGTEVMVWVVRSEGELTEAVSPASSAEVRFAAVPPAEPFTLNGFRNLRCGVTTGAPGLEGTPAEFLPQVALNRETLSDPEAVFYFQTEDAYQVAAEDDAHSLLISLYMPGGEVYFYQSGYIFMPEMNGSDLWVADITSIFEDYARFTLENQRWPAGEYVFAYTIDGREVARIPFTLD